MTKEELLKIARPFLFNTSMVRAILEGRKTVTRKLVKCNLPECDCIIHTRNSKSYVNIHGTHIMERIEVPYSVGDILYVRETFCSKYDGEMYFYLADRFSNREHQKLIDYSDVRWKSSVQMPKEAARIFLRVTGIRIECIDEIDGEEAVKEGFFDKYYCDGRYSLEPVKQFIDYWDWEYLKHDSDRRYHGYYANPWVWVIDFEVVKYD